MKHGKTINELATEIDRQHRAKRDFILPVKNLRPFLHYAESDTSISRQVLNLAIRREGNELFTGGLNTNGHLQLGEYLKIPKTYYDRMKASPELLLENVKHWIGQSTDTRMVRTLDGNVRAFLSQKYRRLDNFDLASQVLPMLNEVNAQVESCEVTDNKLYIKAITHKIQAEVKPGDVVSAGIIISNSETGHGSLSIKPLIFRLVCSNGAIADDLAMKKYHAGKSQDWAEIEYSSETEAAEDTAYWLKVRDLVKHTLTEVTFDKMVERMRTGTKLVIAQPAEAIEMVVKRFGLGQNEKEGVLQHLIQGGELTSYGMGNAITRMAQDQPSYDRSTELESIGYMAMNQNWNQN